jgi:hypothetical protein
VAHRDAALLLLEHLAAMTLFGFLIAESRGRRDDIRSEVLLWTALAALGAGGLLELLYGMRVDEVASVARLMLGVFAAMFGAAHYRVKLRLVRRVLKPTD